jgi:hypothetical protein
VAGCGPHTYNFAAPDIPSLISHGVPDLEFDYRAVREMLRPFMLAVGNNNTQPDQPTLEALEALFVRGHLMNDMGMADPTTWPLIRRMASDYLTGVRQVWAEETIASATVEARIQGLPLTYVSAWDKLVSACDGLKRLELLLIEDWLFKLDRVSVADGAARVVGDKVLPILEATVRCKSWAGLDFLDIMAADQSNVIAAMWLIYVGGRTNMTTKERSVARSRVDKFLTLCSRRNTGGLWIEIIDSLVPKCDPLF